jgi:uncharacterized membrane protein
VFQSRPNQSLTHPGTARVLEPGGAVFGRAECFCALGYWLMLPFAGLEIGLLAWAIKVLRSREGITKPL